MLDFIGLVTAALGRLYPMQIIEEERNIVSKVGLPTQ